MPAESSTDPATLAARFQAMADVARVTADVATLARSPRGRLHHPAELEQAQRYVTDRLAEAGWRVRAVPFERRWVLGVSDAGFGPGRDPHLLRRLRLHRSLRGENLLAELPGAPAGRRVRPRGSVPCGARARARSSRRRP